MDAVVTRPPYVFVSYASRDHARVMPIAAALERIGVRVWMDRSGIAGGANYGPAIVSAIRESAALLLCCSAASYASRNVGQEVALAWKHQVPIVPLLLETATVPEDLAYWLEATQWIEILDRAESDWLPEVLRALRTKGVEITSSPTSSEADLPRPGTIRLPTPLTDLLGREAEVQHVAGSLSIQRLVTLTGPGGVGKTRLAIEAARTSARSFPDGIDFVDLAPLRDAGLVLPTAARALGVQDLSALPVADALAAAIGNHQRLLVLDNVEQVIAAAPGVAALLASCPRLVVLATSRVALAVRGEIVIDIAPLGTVSGERSPTLVELQAVPSVALFAARAAEARPDFVLTEANVHAVAQICARLDGLPLAIELAAARIKLLSPDALLSRLERRLPLLTSGARDLPDRQRTLRDTISWSYDLLAVDVQELLRRVSVFAGGFTLESAEAICGTAGKGEGDTPFSVLDGLTALVDESLLRRLDMSDGEPRFGMLETIREFALDQLDRSGGSDEIYARHFAHFLDVAKKAVMLAEFDAWIRQCDVEFDNLRAAHAWAVARREPERGQELASALWIHWRRSGRLSEGFTWAEQALSAGSIAPTPARAGALEAAGAMALLVGDRAMASDRLGNALALWRDFGERRHIAVILYMLGWLAVDDGRGEDASRLFELAAAEARTVGGGTPVWEALAYWGLSLLAMEQGDLAAATTRLTAMADISSRLKYGWLEGTVRAAQAELARRQGDKTAAAGGFADAIREFRAASDPVGLYRCLAGIAALAGTAGLSEPATRLGWAAIALRERIGHQMGQLESAGWEADVFGPHVTTEHLARAASSQQSIGLEQATAEAQDLAERMALLGAELL